MPALVEEKIGKKVGREVGTGFTPPLELPEEENRDKGEGLYLLLVGVQKNNFFKQKLSKESDDLLKYNFSIIITRLEKSRIPTSDIVCDDVGYLFISENEVFTRYFNYCFLSNMTGKWYTILSQNKEMDVDQEYISVLKDTDFTWTKIDRFHSSKPAEGPLILSQYYLSRELIIVDCKEEFLEDITNADHLRANYKQDLEYLTKKFIPFKEKFPNFRPLQKEDLPENNPISSYKIIDLDGRIIIPKK